MRPRRLLWPEALRPGTHPMPAELQHHALTVLRLLPPSRVELFDGLGHLGSATLLAGERVHIDAVQSAQEQGPQLTVGVCLPRPERSDWLIEKLVEVGAHRIVPLMAARSQGGSLHDAARRRAPRWQRLAAAAARQAERLLLPQVAPLQSLQAFVAEHAELPQRFVAEPSGAAVPCLPPAATAAVLVGPPGGFTPEELQQLEAAQYLGVCVSQYILRTETAAIVAAAALLRVPSQTHAA